MATEEEQQSALLSDEDAEYETPVDATNIIAMGSDKLEERESDRDIAVDDGGMEIDDQDASGEELDEDAEGEEDNDFLLHQQIIVDEHSRKDLSPVDEEGDVDASGEEDEQEEGVGAVKLKPGDSDEDDDEEDEDAQSDVSSLPTVPEDESEEEEAPWEDAGEAEDDDESEAAPTNNCIFCKQDEENDPSEEFEAYLACARCGDNGNTFP